MEGSSQHCPGSKLQAAGEVRAWDCHPTRNHGEQPCLSSTQHQWLSPSCPPGALESPESGQAGH